MSPAMVSLNDQDQILANVSTVKVGYEEVEHVCSRFGTLEIAEPNKTIISARFNGRIEKLYVDAVGAKSNRAIPYSKFTVPILSRQKTNICNRSRPDLPHNKALYLIQNPNCYYWV